jgi:hypothetical protein
VLKIDEKVHGIEPAKLLEEKEEEDLLQGTTTVPVAEFTIHPMESNEIILDMKTVNLKCDKGTKADYICVSTTIIKPKGGEDELYGSRIIVYEILHDLEKVAERNERRSAAVIDCCRGYLLSNTEGPEMSTNTLGFKNQLYTLSKAKKKILDPNPTDPTKIMATAMHVIGSEESKDELVLFADVRKSFSIMAVKEQKNSFVPVLKKAYECYSDVVVKAMTSFGANNKTIVVSTKNSLIQIYSSIYETMQLKGEISLGKNKVTGKILAYVLVYIFKAFLTYL